MFPDLCYIFMLFRNSIEQVRYDGEVAELNFGDICFES